MLGFAVVEMAFGLLMRLPQRIEAERDSANEGLKAYLDDPLRFFIPARIVWGLLLIAAMVLLAQTFGSGLTSALLLLAWGALLYLVVGHLLPPFLVRRSPERTLELLLPLFSATANVLAPLTTLILAWLGPAQVREADEPRGADRTEPAASVPIEDLPPREDGSRLLRSVVDFGETLVREVMTPRPDIVAIPADATIDDLRQLVREQEYSRLPVFTENLDNIVGLVVVKDLIQLPESSAPVTMVSQIMRPASFVPETKRVLDLLREFQQKRFQLAIVVDEYGGTAGLVTVEDVVEELVGEIRDEYDSEADPIVQERDDTFVFSGKVGIDELAERLGTDVRDGEFETVGGYVLARVGRVPAPGERFVFDGLEVEVLEAERRRIHKVRVRRTAAPAVETES
jgi:CBS domain containing-hemolysin-like protein